MPDGQRVSSEVWDVVGEERQMNESLDGRRVNEALEDPTRVGFDIGRCGFLRSSTFFSKKKNRKK